MLEDEKLTCTCELGILSRTDGSASFSQGNTMVIAGIYGPVEAKANKALIEKATIEAHFRPKIGLPGVKDRLNESVVKSVCEAAFDVSLYPRASIVVVVQEVQNNGQLLSCAVNATCLAALNSGIDMKYMFAAVTCHLLQDDVFYLALPIGENEKKASFMFVFDSIEKNIVASHTEGSFTIGEYEEALRLCREESITIFEFFKKSLAIK